MVDKLQAAFDALNISESEVVVSKQGPNIIITYYPPFTVSSALSAEGFDPSVDLKEIAEHMLPVLKEQCLIEHMLNQAEIEIRPFDHPSDPTLLAAASVYLGDVRIYLVPIHRIDGKLTMDNPADPSPFIIFNTLRDKILKAYEEWEHNRLHKNCISKPKEVDNDMDQI